MASLAINSVAPSALFGYIAKKTYDYYQTTPINNKRMCLACHPIKKPDPQWLKFRVLLLEPNTDNDHSNVYKVINSFYSIIPTTKYYSTNIINYCYNKNLVVPFKTSLLYIVDKIKSFYGKDFNATESAYSYIQYFVKLLSTLPFSDAQNVIKIILFITTPGYEYLIDLILNGISQLLSAQTQPFFTDLIPSDVRYYLQLFVWVSQFFIQQANNLAEDHKKWLKTKDPRYYSPCFEYLDVTRAVMYFQYFSIAVQSCFDNKILTDKALSAIINFIRSKLISF